MLETVHDLLYKTIPRKIMDWYSILVPEKTMLFSPDRCCVSFSAEKIFFLHVRKSETKAEILLCESFPYTHIQDIKDILSRVIQKYQLLGVRCSWMLQPEEYQLLQTEALPVPPAEFQSAIRWKIKDLLRFPLEDALIDSFAIPPAKLPTSVSLIMLVVGRISVLKPISDQISASGFNLTTIDIPELGLRNLTAFYEKDEKSTAFIYIQEDYIQLLVTHQQKIYFTRRLDFGLKSIESQKEETNEFIDKIALDMQRSFDYFQSQWRQSEPVRLFLGIGRSSHIDVAKLLAHRLNAPVIAIDINLYFINKTQVNFENEGVFLPMLGEILREWNDIYATGN